MSICPLGRPLSPPLSLVVRRRREGVAWGGELWRDSRGWSGSSCPSRTPSSWAAWPWPRPALAGSDAVADYAAGAAALVAGLFGMAVCDLLGQVQELHARLGRLEFNQSGNLPRGGATEPGAAADGGA